MKTKTFLLIIALSILTIGIEARTVCVVSSNPLNNTGRCQTNIYEGGDICLSYGDGPSCSGTATIVDDK